MNACIRDFEFWHWYHTISDTPLIVAAATEEGVESLRILPYTSVNVLVVKGQRLKFSAVKPRKPRWSTVKRRSRDYRVDWSEVPLTNLQKQMVGVAYTMW